ncbi:6,7-dimethyl-8-ribityllumazine synthase [Schlesneria paludicola]|uniref:6,7-dimethyl-8-ribityllumazine synthase n=1 Tax=Schlesneria paludicola TaxID=360056 RepID=UPI00029B4494|nr:6,7-dimethyl-8-ribityllumazine synthase [Schlesneria paludicola]
MPLTPNVLEGSLLLGNVRVAIVVSRFNDLVTDRLLSGAIDTFRRHGLSDDRITVVRVPGSFEIPLPAKRLADSGQFAAVVCLGAVIQGETSHHEYINHPMASAIMQSSLSSGVPVTFGVLTCQSMDQALDRAGGKAGNKGIEASVAAIEMINLLAIMKSQGL